jgi:hypothetical protein
MTAAAAVTPDTKVDTSLLRVRKGEKLFVVRAC